MLPLFTSLNQAVHKDKRAPHKPLLILLSLANIQAGKPRLLPFSEIEEPLKNLLIEFGPYTKSYKPELPFYHLQNDRVWELSAPNEETQKVLRKLGAANKSFFRNEYILGGFPEPIYQQLRDNPSELRELADYLLNAHFPETIHQDILDAIGLNIDPPEAEAAYTTSKRRTRDPRFRDRILEAYDHQCAVCGFQVLLKGRSIALEAAHIQWHQAGGPDIVVNGLCLCPLHHKLFDRGVFTLDDGLRVQVSEAASGHSQAFKDWMLAYDGREILSPKNPSYFPEDLYVEWHVREVFYGRL
jgi:putative restriction endonuclease